MWPSTYMQDKREIPVIVNEKISDLVHDFMNFNALKIILKIHKKNYERSRTTHTRESSIYLWPNTYMQDMREIPAIVNEKIVIKC